MTIEEKYNHLLNLIKEIIRLNGAIILPEVAKAILKEIGEEESV